MPDRLSSLDASFLYLEDVTTAMHVGSVMVFEPSTDAGSGERVDGERLDGGRLDYDQLVFLITQRIAFAPRYRQRVREVPGGVGNPVWIDDERFDLTYHVRRAALPRPGSEDQLQEFVARIMPRVLDRERPLWEVYLVEGLERDRFALVTKCHQALVDGESTLDIAHLLLDEHPAAPDMAAIDPADVPATPWQPSGAPPDLQLVAEALLDVVRRPGQVLDVARGGVDDVRAVGAKVLAGLGELASTVLRTAARPAPTSPLNAQIGTARRFVMVSTDLEDYRSVRSAVAGTSRSGYADHVSVNDVVLATVAGGLRSWLLTRGEGLPGGSTVRVLVPVSVYDDEAAPVGGLDPRPGQGRVGAMVTAAYVDLPVGEPSPSMRLHQVAFSMRRQLDAGRMIGAEAIAGVAGFAPPTLHALGARLGGAMSRRLFNLVVTNVPGPQQPRYVGGARLVATCPVMPLAQGQALAIGVTSYDGQVCFGLNADREAMPDLSVLAQCLVDALAELVDLAPAHPTAHPTADSTADSTAHTVAREPWR